MGEAIARVVFNLTLPCLIIVTFSDVEFSNSLLYLIVIAFVYGLGIGLLGLILLKRDSRYDRGMFGMMIPGLNIGLFAYPLVEGLWGLRGIKVFWYV
ncbi:hypothetical protein [Gracilibacillus sp. JCM 18860]|uniref:hypothetical protein n=1 Tax=Gracilibacillus sp. JCM 18860 TaxID=1306159 RepID=UPI000AAC4952